MSNTIIMTHEGSRRDEAIASGTPKPGHLLEMTTAITDTAKVHATEGGYAEKIAAVEDSYQGGTVTTAYVAGAQMQYDLIKPGTELQMVLKAGEDVSKNDKLISAGDGTLIAEGSASSGITIKQIIAWAREAKDLSASGAVDTLMNVRMA